MTYYWWILQAVLCAISLFFLLFGIDLLYGSYSLHDPFNFVMTFFAASLIILISLTLLAGFIIRMIRVYKETKNNMSGHNKSDIEKK